jgi:hypothetical protein
VYPHGSTNAYLDSVVGRFYTFARTTDPGPEAYPFGSPLRVKTFELHSPGDGSDGSAGTLTTISQAGAAIADAREYRQTLIITAHRIHGTATDPPGYPLDMFREIVDLVRESNLPVVTLSQLDAMNGIPESDNIFIRPAVPTVMTVEPERSGPRRQHKGFWERLWDDL